MPSIRRSLARWLPRFTALAAGALSLSMAAEAESMPAPESPYRSRERAEPRERRDAREARDERVTDPWNDGPEPSLFRLHVGPAVLIQPASPGLMTALDVGRRAVGLRLSASWLRAESERGLASYTGELWVDLARRYELHPVLGAGVSFLHGGALGQQRNAGAGVLRGALEYQLPLEDADARLSLNCLALVPAIESERTRPWFQAGLTIGAGF